MARRGATGEAGQGEQSRAAGLHLQRAPGLEAEAAAGARRRQPVSGGGAHLSSSSSWRHAAPPCGAASHPAAGARWGRAVLVALLTPAAAARMSPPRATAAWQMRQIQSRQAPQTHLLLGPASPSIAPNLGLHLAAAGRAGGRSDGRGVSVACPRYDGAADEQWHELHSPIKRRRLLYIVRVLIPGPHCTPKGRGSGPLAAHTAHIQTPGTMRIAGGAGEALSSCRGPAGPEPEQLIVFYLCQRACRTGSPNRAQVMTRGPRVWAAIAPGWRHLARCSHRWQVGSGAALVLRATGANPLADGCTPALIRPIKCACWHRLRRQVRCSCALPRLGGCNACKPCPP